MRRARFLVSTSSHASDTSTVGTTAESLVGTEITLCAEESRHLAEVLRMKVDDQVDLFCTSRQVSFSGRILRVDSKQSLVKIESCAPSTEKRRTRLIIAVLKPAKNELVVEKATELGLSEIHFFLAERTQGNSQRQADSANRRRRLELIRDAALKQSTSEVFTQIFFHESLPKALRDIHGPNKLKDRNIPAELRMLMSAPCSDYLTVNTEDSAIQTEVSLTKGLFTRESLETIGKSDDSSIIIGPEGGLSKSEAEVCSEAHYQSYSLGSTTLRAETAAILAAGFVAQAASVET